MPIDNLTAARRALNLRRKATGLMIVAMLVCVSIGPASAGAVEPAREQPLPLIERGLRDATLVGSPARERQALWASWLPRLTLGVSLASARVRGQDLAETIIYTELRWPLERAPPRDSAAVLRDLRQRAAARESLVEKIAAAWHRRQQADNVVDELDAELDAEEAEAELDATSDVVGERP